MRVLLIGHGRMGRLVETAAPDHGAEIAAVITGSSSASLATADFGRVDVAIDFSRPEAVLVNLPILIARGINVVIGTTGWGAEETAMRESVKRAGTGVIAASNFSIGMLIFRHAIMEATRRFAVRPEFSAWIHETHHAAKLDAPSGTAISIRAAMEAAGYSSSIGVSSTRAGSFPGTHTVGFDASSESLTFTHDVRDRVVFAHGALVAARWIIGRTGWYGIDDVLS